MSASSKSFLLTSRGEILRVLYCVDAPMGVRAIARCAAIGLRSVQVALATLVKERCVVVRSVGHRPVYVINRSHEDYPLWKAVFDAMAKSLIEQRRDVLQDRAARLLPFLEDSLQMVRRAKVSYAT